jgi:hypothetical protein
MTDISPERRVPIFASPPSGDKGIFGNFDTPLDRLVRAVYERLLWSFPLQQREKVEKLLTDTATGEGVLGEMDGDGIFTPEKPGTRPAYSAALPADGHNRPLAGRFSTPDLIDPATGLPD